MVVIKVTKQTLKAIVMPADNKYRNGNIILLKLLAKTAVIIR